VFWGTTTGFASVPAKSPTLALPSSKCVSAFPPSVPPLLPTSRVQIPTRPVATLHLKKRKQPLDRELAEKVTVKVAGRDVCRSSDRTLYGYRWFPLTPPPSCISTNPVLCYVTPLATPQFTPNLVSLSLPPTAFRRNGLRRCVDDTQGTNA
jgi:hypothetical protein